MQLTIGKVRELRGMNPLTVLGLMELKRKA
jgi:hypothetical protein